jgi:hypothetical protein
VRVLPSYEDEHIGVKDLRQGLFDKIRVHILIMIYEEAERTAADTN